MPRPSLRSRWRPHQYPALGCRGDFSRDWGGVPEWLAMKTYRRDVPEDVDDTDKTGIAGSGGGVDTALRTGTFAVSIYLSDGAGHDAVEDAVTRALELTGATIAYRDDPVLGSWFRRMWANPATREVAMTAAHVADTRLVHQPDSQVTATLLQHIGPVITALQPEKEAVVRLGAVLIIKLNEQLMVHQLTAAQQFQLDHQPQVVAPRDIISALGLPPPANGHPNCSLPGIDATTGEGE